MKTIYPNQPNSGYDKEDLELELKKFQEFFPGKRLLCIQLDGFSHRVIWDDVPRTPKAHCVDISFCMGEAEEQAYCRSDEDRRLHKAGRDFLRALGFAGHSSYQNNPTEIIYVDPEDR